MPAKTSRKRQTQFSTLGVFSFGLLLILSLPYRVDATVLDWPSAPGWTAGVPAAGETVTQSFTADSPNDVTVSINNNDLGPQGATWQSGYPTIDSTTKTGGLSGVNGLQLSVASESSTSSFVRTTITFATPVAGLTLQLWDVDAAPGQFVDKISSIQATAVGGGIVGATSVTSAVPGYNVISGSGLSTVVLGTSAASDSTNQGTINITFSGQITQFSFDYSNNDSALGAQGIAIGSLTYAIVPESNPFFCVALLCAIAIGLDGCRRRNNASR